MVLFYYTSVAFLDISLEVINALKKSVELHVIIEISPEAKAINILNVSSIDHLPTLALPEQVLDKETLSFFQPYFKDAASVHFFVQKNPKTFSIDMLRDCGKLAQFIKTISPDIIHFDTGKSRAIGLVPFLFRNYRKKVFITVHDPVPHSGEFNWRHLLFRKSFYPLAGGFIFHSAFSEKIFLDVYPKYKGNTAVFKMHPYTFYKNYLPEKPVERKSILFFGRISLYKGVDTFLKAIPLVLQQFPDEQFIIAGSSGGSFSLDENDVLACGNNLTLLLKHVPNEQLVELAAAAKFAVCPYRDATQSGVLMTAFACNTGVIASNVGAFPEFIQEGVNGDLCTADDPVKLAFAIASCLQTGSWQVWQDTLKKTSQENAWLTATTGILKAYQNRI